MGVLPMENTKLMHSSFELFAFGHAANVKWVYAGNFERVKRGDKIGKTRP